MCYIYVSAKVRTDKGQTSTSHGGHIIWAHILTKNIVVVQLINCLVSDGIRSSKKQTS